MASPSTTANPPTKACFKLLLVGDSGVGKTCLLHAFKKKEFNRATPATIGADFETHQHVDGGETHLVKIWDTAGNERFRSLASSFYRGAHGVIFVFDMTNRKTFENVQKHWVAAVDDELDLKPVRMLVANKLDLQSRRAVMEQEGNETQKNLGMDLYRETSAKREKEPSEVEMAFEAIIKKILDRDELVAHAKTPDNKGISVRPAARRRAKRGCC